MNDTNIKFEDNSNSAESVKTKSIKVIRYLVQAMICFILIVALYALFFSIAISILNSSIHTGVISETLYPWCLSSLIGSIGALIIIIIKPLWSGIDGLAFKLIGMMHHEKKNNK